MKTMKTMWHRGEPTIKISPSRVCTDSGKRRERQDHNPKNPLLRAGWASTPAGRWVDPQTQRSHTAMEAWAIINERG